MFVYNAWTAKQFRFQFRFHFFAASASFFSCSNSVNNKITFFYVLLQLAIIITEVKTGLFLQQWIEFNVQKVVVKIFQGSVVTQTVLGGLTIYPRVANFLQCTVHVPKIMKLGRQ